MYSERELMDFYGGASNQEQLDLAAHPDTQLRESVRELLQACQRPIENALRIILTSGGYGYRSLPEHFRPRLELFMDRMTRDYVLKTELWSHKEGKPRRIAMQQAIVTRSQTEAMCTQKGQSVFRQVEVAQMMSKQYYELWQLLHGSMFVYGLEAAHTSLTKKDEPINEKEQELVVRNEPGPGRDEVEDPTIDLPFGDFLPFSANVE